MFPAGTAEAWKSAILSLDNIEPFFGAANAHVTEIALAGGTLPSVQNFFQALMVRVKDSYFRERFAEEQERILTDVRVASAASETAVRNSMREARDRAAAAAAAANPPLPEPPQVAADAALPTDGPVQICSPHGQLKYLLSRLMQVCQGMVTGTAAGHVLHIQNLIKEHGPGSAQQLDPHQVVPHVQHLFMHSKDKNGHSSITESAAIQAACQLLNLLCPSRVAKSSMALPGTADRQPLGTEAFRALWPDYSTGSTYQPLTLNLLRQKVNELYSSRQEQEAQNMFEPLPAPREPRLGGGPLPPKTTPQRSGGGNYRSSYAGIVGTDGTGQWQYELDQFQRTYRFHDACNTNPCCYCGMGHQGFSCRARFPFLNDTFDYQVKPNASVQRRQAYNAALRDGVVMALWKKKCELMGQAWFYPQPVTMDPSPNPASTPSSTSAQPSGSLRGGDAVVVVVAAAAVTQANHLVATPSIWWLSHHQSTHHNLPCRYHQHNRGCAGHWYRTRHPPHNLHPQRHLPPPLSSLLSQQP